MLSHNVKKIKKKFSQTVLTNWNVCDIIKMFTEREHRKGGETMISPNIIGTRIKNRREELGMSREIFCQAVGITQSAASMYETGQRIPRDEIKINIARVLKTTIEALFFAE